MEDRRCVHVLYLVLILTVGFNVVNTSVFIIHNNISMHIVINIITVNTVIDLNSYERGVDYNLMLLLILVLCGYIVSRYNLNASLIISDLVTLRLFASSSS